MMPVERTKADDPPPSARPDPAAERRALIAEVAFQKREAEIHFRELEHVRGELARIDGSVTWKVLQRVRGKLYALLGGPDARLGRALGAALRRLGRSGGRVMAQRRWRDLRMPAFPIPDVSIVIPVHSEPELTERCLRAIVAAGDSIAYEVIVVDDAADPDTKRLLRAVAGIRVVVNKQNQGYLHSTNRGAAIATGRHIVLLNNDTEPQPGWLDALVARVDSAPNIGVVATKLVYPDGGLQEAGGIVWSDGTPWNFGNRQRADAPEYNYARHVDYGSAAALLVRAELWREVGGFDTRYAPGYFEDTDLCFTARALGWLVMYDPQAVVIHHEGGSMGTDVATGGKRHQLLNQPKFTEKWREALCEQPSQPAPERAYMASDHRRGPQVLVIDHRVPTPDRDSGSLRMWGMLEGLIDLGCRVAFLPDNFQGDEPYATRLRAMGVEVLDGPVVVPERMAAFGSRLALAVLSRPYVSARYVHLVREYAPQAKLAYDTVDLHFLRERRRVEHAEGDDDLRVAEAFEHLELALARAADVTLVVSGEERGHLLGVAPELDVVVLPNANEIAAEVPGRDGRSGLVFVGGFEHTPNVDAVEFLVGEVMPIVWRDAPEVAVTIVGGNAPQEVLDLASDRVEVVGWVEDLQPLLDSSIAAIAPLRFGAGMKGKVTQSLAVGLPVITTSIGAEGMNAVDGHDLLLAEKPEAIAAQVVRLSRDPDLWQRLSSSGQELADRVCSPRVQRDVLARLLARTSGTSGSASRSARADGATESATVARQTAK